MRSNKNNRLRFEEERAKRLTPVGLKVVVTKDDGSKVESVTKSEPWLMGGHSWMVMLDGISGGYSVGHVEPV